MLSQVRRLIRTEASKRYFVLDQQGEKTLSSHYSENWQSKNQSRNLKEWLTGCLIVEKRWQTKKENLEAAESYEVWGETLPWTGSGPPALAQALLEVPSSGGTRGTSTVQWGAPAPLSGQGRRRRMPPPPPDQRQLFYHVFRLLMPRRPGVCAIICKAETEFRRKATSVDIWCLKTNGSSGKGMATDC